MSSRICFAFCTPGSLAAVAANCAVGQAAGEAGGAAGGASGRSCAAAKAAIVRVTAKIDVIRMAGCDCKWKMVSSTRRSMEEQKGVLFEFELPPNGAFSQPAFAQN